MKGPCHNCADRELGCHDHCIAYRKWKAEVEAVNAKTKEMYQTLKESEGKRRKGVFM